VSDFKRTIPGRTTRLVRHTAVTLADWKFMAQIMRELAEEGIDTGAVMDATHGETVVMLYVASEDVGRARYLWNTRVSGN